MPKKLVIIKKRIDESESLSETESSNISEPLPVKDGFKILDDNDIKSTQKNMTKQEIRDDLKGFKSLKSHEYLLKLPLYKTPIKYFNQTKKAYRTGGQLMKVDPELRFIMLVNFKLQKSWSVQLNDNIIFIPEDSILSNDDVNNLKDKLYEMYINNNIQTKQSKPYKFYYKKTKK